MKLYWGANVFGWILWGLVGKRANWFLGLSINPQWKRDYGKRV